MLLKSSWLHAVLAAAVLILVGVLPAIANVSVSTNDGVTLTLDNTGVFVSMTVNGNTVPTLTGVAGGFFIIPCENLPVLPGRNDPPGAARVDFTHTTNYVPCSTAVTGTATQVGSDIHLTTGTIQNHTFDIWIRGGLPYLNVQGTVTGTTTNDKAFLLDFRLPVNANNWTWYNRLQGTPDGSDADGAVPSSQIINTGSTSNWYYARALFFAGRHSWQSIHPYASVSAYDVSGVSNMGISMGPLLYPPQSALTEYNVQTGFLIEFELATTTKTTTYNPNTTNFYFVLYQHNPKWGIRAAVQRYQSFFPSWWNRITPGGNWFVGGGGSGLVTTPSDFAIKYMECHAGSTWQNSDPYWNANNIMTMRYSEPWCWHSYYLDTPTMTAKAQDIPANQTTDGCCGTNNNKVWNRDVGQLLLLSSAMNPDGSYWGVGDPAFNDSGLIRIVTNPDPELPNFLNFTPGRNRSQIDEDLECRRMDTASPPDPPNPPGGDVCTGACLDSAAGYWSGWGVTHNFNPNHWANYSFSPGIYWDPDDARITKYGNGLVCMWEPMSNVKFLKYFKEQMVREGRPLIANGGGPVYETQLITPFVDVMGCESSITDANESDLGLARALAGPKVSTFLYGNDVNSRYATAVEMNKALPWIIYPGAGYGATENADAETARPVYQQYMPIFATLDAAIWRPVTGATSADSTQVVERYGPDATGAYYFVLRAENCRDRHGHPPELRPGLGLHACAHHHLPARNRPDPLQ